MPQTSSSGPQGEEPENAADRAEAKLALDLQHLEVRVRNIYTGMLVIKAQ